MHQMMVWGGTLKDEKLKGERRTKLKIIPAHLIHEYLVLCQIRLTNNQAQAISRLNYLLIFQWIFIWVLQPFRSIKISSDTGLNDGFLVCCCFDLKFFFIVMSGHKNESKYQNTAFLLVALHTWSILTHWHVEKKRLFTLGSCSSLFCLIWRISNLNIENLKAFKNLRNNPN